MIKPIRTGLSACVLGAVLSSLCLLCRAEPGPDLYCGMDAASYLTGRFEPEREGCFVEISALGIPVMGGRQYLRREAAEALARMFRDFRKAHPGAEFVVRSSTRTWGHQKAIWEDKWFGRTPVGGVRLNKTVADPAKRAAIILEYSSMPGTSRHHWGTDFDLQELNNSYYETGRGAVLYRWLVANAGSYGFCRPYTAGRKAGYREEKWHWSYLPLAKRLLSDWVRLFKDDPGKITASDGFAGSESCVHLAPIFVESINDFCR
ncbi:MAG TPA: M15 family metallopeptidase [Spirochaetota bacterium]|nr:M15 family metallopeptidase [Spirochaetota bacterium]OPZ39338.1 MAG: D-alanyl-D-alanine carboxypeptidase [Spirochaetes bacterium ADurb.BinA120]HNU90329.1 M15 family metallopeptidase [Spirochaetota bacterium]HPI13145.1 M15 family metallopeptidase [Spirochaetota bacterium]HPO44962.1 M15 family metallopeptidase [Spirochaetota bacterium]